MISTTHGPVATSACDFCNPVLTIEIKKLTALKDCVRRGISQDLEESYNMDSGGIAANDNYA